MIESAAGAAPHHGTVGMRFRAVSPRCDDGAFGWVVEEGLECEMEWVKGNPWGPWSGKILCPFAFYPCVGAHTGLGTGKV